MSGDKCLYCYMEDDGDVPDNRKSLFYFNFIKIFGRDDIGLDAMIVYNSIDICTDNAKKSKQIKINYCPMCGRRLRPHAKANSHSRQENGKA